MSRKLPRVVKREKVITRRPEGGSHSWLSNESPRIQVKRKNGTVDAIEVMCTCGRTMEIICEYEAPAAGAESTGG